MRFAYVASSVTRRSELAAGPIDAEWLAAAPERHKLTVLVDEETAGSDLLREAGVAVHPSPKRSMDIPELGEIPADHVQAHLLAQLHREEALDAIVYDSAQTTDLAWYEPELGSVPRGIALGRGAVRDVRLVLDDPTLFARHGRRAWAATGAILSADFLVSDAPPACYGFVGKDFPPRLAIRSPVPLTPPPPGVEAELVVVIGLNEDRAGLAGLTGRAADRVGAGPGTSFVVIHPNIEAGRESTRDIAVAGCPAGMAAATAFVDPDDDGVAAAFLEQADVIAAARLSDLMLPAVADAAISTPVVLLEPGDGTDALRFDDGVPEKRPAGRPILVPIDRSLAEIASLLGGLADEEADVAILHDEEGESDARRLMGLPNLAMASLSIVCGVRPVFGDADVAQPGYHVLAIARPVWPAAMRLMPEAGSLYELMVWLLSLSNVEHATLRAFPSMNAGGAPLPLEDVAGLPAWISSDGALPRPNLASVRAAGEAAPTGVPVRAWVEGHRWSERARLILPWKSGLLERAMRGRW